VTEPITGRKTLAPLISEETATELGEQAFAQVLQEHQRSTDPEQTELVRRVGRRIAEVTDARMRAEGRQRYDWEFEVIDDPDSVNAFALPGGKVAFFTGILPVCKNETGVAVVMGHEIGHAFAEHGRRRASETALAQFGLGVVQQALSSREQNEVSGLAAAALGLGYQYGVALPFSRADETAADEIGLVLMAQAGYDPREAVDFWQRMHAAAAGGGAPPEFLSTHPSPESRIRNIREALPRALEFYESSAALSQRRVEER
jgi:predicted Zn-dependent protease